MGYIVIFDDGMTIYKEGICLDDVEFKCFKKFPQKKIKEIRRKR